MTTPIYILHVLKGDPAQYDGQFCFSTCINEFINSYCGHFENGRWCSDELSDDVIYHIDELKFEGLYPPDIIVDLIWWLDSHQLWSPWMNNFSQIAILKRYVESTETSM